MLFHDTTNTKSAEDISLGDMTLEEIPVAKKVRGGRAGQKEKVEVVINVRSKIRKVAGSGKGRPAVAS